MKKRKPHRRKPARALSKRIEPDYVVPVGLYDIIVNVFYTLDQMRSWTKQEGMKHWIIQDAEAMAFRGLDRNKVIRHCVYLPKKVRIDLLAHECVHLANMILDTCGVGVSLMNDEAQAYLVQYLVGAVDRHSTKLSRSR